MKTLLVTGGAGFIGSHMVDHLLKNPDYRVINVDKLTYAGNLENLSLAQSHPNHVFVQGDITDKTLLQSLFNDYEIEGVIHLAAESHVDNSIDKPDDFIQTNIVGTFCLLEAVRASNKSKSVTGIDSCRFHHVSTDEVYGSLGPEGYFTESTPYQPNSPYSASKASSDMLVRSYCKTYGLNAVITNCSNNFGPRQHDEKLIPTVIRRALAHEPIPIYGQGNNVRDWLFVTDHCKAIDLVFHQGGMSETYNIGAHAEYTNIQIAQMICQILDKIQPWEKPYSSLIQFTQDRPGHDFRYAIDSKKINQLGWQSESSFKDALQQTVLWAIQKSKNNTTSYAMETALC